MIIRLGIEEAEGVLTVLSILSIYLSYFLSYFTFLREKDVSEFEYKWDNLVCKYKGNDL